MNKKELLQNEIDRHRRVIEHESQEIEYAERGIGELTDKLNRALERKEDSQFLLKVAERNFAEAIREEQKSEKAAAGFMTQKNNTDYFLRYSADIPDDENEHDDFNPNCWCNPKVEFDKKSGWRRFTHQPMSEPNEKEDEKV